MNSFLGELQDLMLEVRAMGSRYEVSECFGLQPRFKQDFSDFENLFVFANNILAGQEGINQQFSFMKEQIKLSIEVAKVIVGRLDIADKSLVAALSRIHDHIVRCHLPSLLLFLELQISAHGGVTRDDWEAICF